MAISSSRVARWPISPPIVYLAAGMLIGPLGLGLLDPELRDQGRLTQTIAEIAILLALFSIGLRLRMALEWRVWRVPVRLATVSMLTTIALAAAAAHVFFDLTFAQALLLGAILAPTDPLLVSDVQLPPGYGDETARTFLITEGVLTQGLALSAVLFALGLAGRHDLGPLALRWATLDLAWSIGGGLATGWVAGAATARWLLRLDRERQLDLPEELFALAAVVLAYVGALALGGSGFLAVFAAAIALSNGGRLRPVGVPRRLSPRLLQLAHRLEHFAEVGIVLLLGAMLGLADIRPEMFVFALVLLVLVRPTAVRLGLAGVSLPPAERRVVAWFGLRGIASIYCLMYAINEGLGAPFARELTAITLVALATSIVLHGLTATPPLGRHLDERG